MANDFWTKTTSSLNFYSSSSNTGTEADMRQEFINTLDGAFPEVAKAQTGLIRKMRRDSNDRLIPCSCVNSITREPDKDRFCGICFGEGWLWDESLIEFYRTLEDSDIDNATKDKLRPPGLINNPLVVFYTKYDADITLDDKIVQINLGIDGSVPDTIRRKVIYRLESVWDYRSDGGRLEYYKLFSHKEDVKYLNAPSYTEV